MRKIFFYTWAMIKALLISSLALAQVTKVDAIGITVKDMNTSLKFYTEVLGFKKVSDNEYKGDGFEKLEGVFGLNIRVARLQLGDEFCRFSALSGVMRRLPPSGFDQLDFRRLMHFP